MTTREGVEIQTMSPEQRKRPQDLTEFAVVKNADMSERMQQHAIDCAAYAFGEKRILDDIA